jgi:hypothetical protein
MAGKGKAATAQRPRAVIGAAQYTWEYRPDGSIFWTHTPPKLEHFQGAVEIPWSPIWCAGYDVDSEGKKHYHHIEAIPCHCPPGPQIVALASNAFEVALGGGRGSAKTATTFGFLVKGNDRVNLENPRPVDVSYLHSKHYKFLVLRRNAKDLKEYLERAKQFFGPFGGDVTESPMGVRFPHSGAWGIFDHLADADAYEKYQGQEFARIVVEEAGQIPEEELYLKILMSCRSPHADLIPQVMLTFNPGGPGARWNNARFVKIRKEDGALVQPGETYVEPLTGRSRVFIFSRVDDNPLLLSRGYDTQLDLLKNTQPTLYRRWRLGDFDAIEGQYFESFREKRMPNEPPEALHVIEPIHLAAHWPRAIGMDWGYSHNSGVVWGCWHPKEQLHIYREFVVSRMSTVEIGAEIAKKSLADLEQMPDPHLTLYLSHDAFHRDNASASEAEQIAAGINLVIGKNAAFVLSPDQEEEFLEDKVAWDSVLRRQRELESKTHITIVNAGNQKRKAGFNLMRELMRWWPIANDNTKLSDEALKKILLEQGALAWYEAKQRGERQRNETLPKFQVWSCCPKLVAGIVGAVEKEDDTEDVEKQDGDDILDACLVAGTQVETVRGSVPIEHVQRGDLVLTREGYRPVLESGVTADSASLFSIQLSNGVTLTGTANHPVFVHGAGFVPIGKLQPGDAVLLCDQRSLSSTESSSADTQILRGGTYGSTTGPVEIIDIVASEHSIKRSGNSPTAPYLKAATSTTETKTPSTTTSTTWSASQNQSITANTQKIHEEESTFCGLPLSAEHPASYTTGKEAQWGAGSIVTGLSESGRAEDTVHCSAVCAAGNSVAAQHKMHGCARTTAEPQRAAEAGWTTKPGHAHSADNRSSAINTCPQSTARAHVLSVIATGRGAVYNLTVAERPEYFANGVLVHNCLYLTRNFKFHEARKSREMIVADRLQQIREREPGISVPSLILAAELNEREWLKGTGSATFARIPRRAGPSRRFAGRVN